VGERIYCSSRFSYEDDPSMKRPLGRIGARWARRDMVKMELWI
jgi:hypothetical protein